MKAGFLVAGVDEGRLGPQALARPVDATAHRMAPVDTITPEYARLREAITERLNAHDLFGVMEHGAPATEYDPEMEDFAALVTAGVPITRRSLRPSGISGSASLPRNPPHLPPEWKPWPLTCKPSRTASCSTRSRCPGAQCPVLLPRLAVDHSDGHKERPGHVTGPSSMRLDSGGCDWWRAQGLPELRLPAQPQQPAGSGWGVPAAPA